MLRGAFDVIMLSDVLEHVLDPEAVVARLADVCTPGTRVIVHVPWNEDLAAYADSDYEFTHLRKFTSYSFARLFRHFYIRRTRPTWRSLEEPIAFKVMDRVPRFLQGAVSLAYFYTRLAAWESSQTERWIAELPRRERVAPALLRTQVQDVRAVARATLSAGKVLTPFRKPTVR